MNLQDSELSKEQTSVKGRSKRVCVEIQLGMVCKSHRWMRSLRLHEDIGGKSVELNDELNEESSAEFSKLVDEA